MPFTIKGRCPKKIPPKKAKCTQEVEMIIKIGKDLQKTPVRFCLFGNNTPLTVKNFYDICTNKDLVINGQRLTYDGCTFHRIIKDFMIQGGDFTSHDGRGGMSIYGDKFEDENFDVLHGPGVLAMANSGPDTNGSQFFITTTSTDWLNDKHVVFGRVIKGNYVIASMNRFGSQSGIPQTDIKIVECYDPNVEYKKLN